MPDENDEYVLMSLLNLAKSFSFLRYSCKTFHIFGAAAVNDLSPKSAVELSGRVIRPHYSAGYSENIVNIYEITWIHRPQIVNSLEKDHSDCIANSELHR